MPRKKAQEKSPVKLEKISRNEIMTFALEKAGMTPERVAEMLHELCNWETAKVDRDGNVHTFVDGALRLKAIDLWARITGGKKGTEHKHLHLEKLPNGELDRLFRKAR